MFSITEFMSKADNLGSLARKHKFTVEIIAPKALTGNPQKGQKNDQNRGVS